MNQSPDQPLRKLCNILCLSPANTKRAYHIKEAPHSEPGVFVAAAMECIPPTEVLSAMNDYKHSNAPPAALISDFYRGEVHETFRPKSLKDKEACQFVLSRVD